MRFPPSLLDEIRARLPVSQVVARKVQLKKAGREYKGLSPFKVEKTPSFTVNDQKGFYHCFATGEHGDIFGFVMKTEGLSFPEAVERLAQEAGVAIPKPDQREIEREDARTRLLALVEASAAFFSAELAGGAQGGEARRYLLEKRGLSRDAFQRYRLGYAPNSRNALKDHLAKLGYSTEEMIASGMLIGGDDIPVAYDRFRHRVMFPIADLRGRIIAFGGRALAADAPAKYLNSPETPLFHKGGNLYHAHSARQAAYDKGRIIAVEGYMDVVALAEAGFLESVAPLGTALTEDQVKILWRMAPEPILCFDGDSAGQKAAFRAIDTVLPHLKAGKSVRFVFLPGGLDPDDYIRNNGPKAFEDVLKNHAKPLFDVMIQREELQSGAAITPEQRASYEIRLKSAVSKIVDPAVRSHYERELKAILWQRSRDAANALTNPEVRRRSPIVSDRRNNVQQDWRNRLPGSKALTRVDPRSPPKSRASNELLGVRARDALPQREALLVLALLNHHWLLEEFPEQIAALSLASKPLIKLRDALLEVQARNTPLDTAGIRAQLTDLGLDRLVSMTERAITHKSDRFAAPDAERHTVENGWHHAMALHERQVGLRRALEAAEQAFLTDQSEEALARIIEIQRLLAQSMTIEEAGAA